MTQYTCDPCRSKGSVYSPKRSNCSACSSLNSGIAGSDYSVVHFERCDQDGCKVQIAGVFDKESNCWGAGFPKYFKSNGQRWLGNSSDLRPCAPEDCKYAEFESCHKYTGEKVTVFVPHDTYGVPCLSPTYYCADGTPWCGDTGLLIDCDDFQPGPERECGFSVNTITSSKCDVNNNLILIAIDPDAEVTHYFIAKTGAPWLGDPNSLIECC